MRPVEIFDRALGEGRKILTVYESKLAISSYGIPVTEMKLAKSEEDAIEAAKQIGYPVVLKIVSPDVIHKTDVGGVVLGIESEEKLREAYRRVLECVKRRVPGARVQGVLVEEMVEEGVEVIIGGLRDEQFGPVVLFGLGGIFVEVLRDVSYGIAPVDEAEALEMIERTRAYRLLKGYRGRRSCDISALANAISRTSEFLWELREYIAELDLNPVFVLEDGRGLKVADARIVLGLTGSKDLGIQ